MPSDKPIAPRASRSVPQKHAEILDRITREETERHLRMALATASGSHVAQRAELERLAPGSRIAVPRWRSRRTLPLSTSKRRGLLADHTAALAPLNEELRRDAVLSQRRMRESLAGIRRRQVVGDPTDFVLNFTAARLVTSTDITLSDGAGAFVTPIATSTAFGKNGSRFVAFASSPVGPFSGALVHINQSARFTFTGCPAGAVTITALLGLMGTFRIVAPGAQFQGLGGTIVPSPYLNITGTVVIVATAPTAPPPLRVTLPFPTFGTLLDRRVSSPQGPVTGSGFLQSTPSSMTAAPFALVAGATITVDVSIGVQLFTLCGGTIVVDCSTAAGAGLLVPGVMLRVDY